MMTLLLCIYITGVVLFGALFTVAIVVVGGFQESRDRMVFMDPSLEWLTSNSVQWVIAFYVIFWPLAVTTVFLVKRKKTKQDS